MNKYSVSISCEVMAYNIDEAIKIAMDAFNKKNYGGDGICVTLICTGDNEDYAEMRVDNGGQKNNGSL